MSGGEGGRQNGEKGGEDNVKGKKAGERCINFLSVLLGSLNSLCWRFLAA